MHLYLHIPFCRSRCAYCDFTSYAGVQDRIPAYVEAVCAELEMLREAYAGAHLYGSPGLRPSVFLGGGTPSLLTPPQVAQLLRGAGALVPLTDAEVTMEANPGTLMGADRGLDARAYFQSVWAAGINRISLGVQSLEHTSLSQLGRIHTADEAARCVQAAHAAGFEHIGVDLLAGLPGQTVQTLDTTLQTVISWPIDHLSLYTLILEEHTPLWAKVMRGEVSLPDDDQTADMMERATERLAGAGFCHYEISNWTRSQVCAHNVSYWRNDDYLAAGAGAHGHVFPHRYVNVAGVDDYLALVGRGQRPLAEVVPLTPMDRCAETMFMGLRMHEGIAFDHFARRCGRAMQAVYGEVLAELQAAGLVEVGDSRVWMTPRGRMLGNRVFERFV